MSQVTTRKSTAGKSAKSAGSSLVEVPFPVTPQLEGTNPSVLPFPEWSDQDINAEKWDSVKVKGPEKIDKVKSNRPGSQHFFLDEQGVLIPPSIEVTAWKRIGDVYLENEKVIFANESSYSDLILGSKHILHCEFVRSFISSIYILEYLGYTRGIQTENCSPTLIPNTDDKPWKPWNHIYSMCRAGKGQTHSPKVNESGKYVVRLYWMDAWRKVYVDDLIPVDFANHPLLPSTHEIVEIIHQDNNRSQLHATLMTMSLSFSQKDIEPDVTCKKPVELWPFLLSKALLKLASLTYSDTSELTDFDIVSCLTGWISHKIELHANIDQQKTWELCKKYAENFAWPEDSTKVSPTGDPASPKLSETETSKSEEDTLKSGSKTSKKSKTKKGAKESKKSKKKNLVAEADSFRPSYVVGQIGDLRLLSSAMAPDILPCWGHSFLIDQTRDVPVIKPEPEMEIPLWKTFRWMDWAIDQGIVQPPNRFANMKFIKYVSPFPHCIEHVTYDEKDYGTPDTRSVNIVIPTGSDKDQNKADHKKKNGKKGKSVTKSSKKSTASPKKSKSGSSKKSSSSSKTRQNKLPIHIPDDPSIWTDFNMICPYIRHLVIYYRPSKFTYKVKVSDICPHLKLKDDGKDKNKPTLNTSIKFIQGSLNLKRCRNEPFYSFMDSLDTKFCLVRLCQTGNLRALVESDCQDSDEELVCPVNFSKYYDTMNQPEKETTAPSGHKFEADSTAIQHPSTFGMLQRIKLSSTLCPPSSCHNRANKRYKPNINECEASVVFEEFAWSSEVACFSAFLSSFGSSTIVLSLPPGRVVLKVYIHSSHSYVVNIYSDTEVEFGCLEEILEAMSSDPQTMLNMSLNVASTFGKLIEAFGTTDFRQRLIEFFTSYKPECALSKKERKLIHDVYRQKLIELLVEIFKDEDPKETSDALYALSVLFLDTSLDPVHIRAVHSAENVLCKSLDGISLSDDELQIYKNMQRAATKIQGLFRRIHVNYYFSLHNSSHKKHYNILTQLKKIYMKLFSVGNRLQFCPILLRRFLYDPRMTDIAKNYHVSDDMQSVLTLQHFSGVINVVSTDSWLPITRYVFVCTQESVKIRIHLFSDMESYMVRVFDNTTRTEMKRIANNVCLNVYGSKPDGYTVLCYGWPKINKKINWKLTFASLKSAYSGQVVVKDVPFTQKSVSDYYLPSKTNLLFKYTLDVRSFVILTARLSASFRNAKLQLTLLNQDGKVIDSSWGIGSVMLPVCLLYSSNSSNNEVSNGVLDVEMTSMKSKGKQKIPSVNLGRRQSRRSSQNCSEFSRIYSIEGYVFEGSWPLNRSEWKVVNVEKKKRLFYPILPTNTTKESRTSITQTALRKPYWLLEMIHHLNDVIQISKDTKREDEIKSIKRTWYESDETRYERSKELRRQYLLRDFPPQNTPGVIPYDGSSSDCIGSLASVELVTIFYSTSEEMVDSQVPRESLRTTENIFSEARHIPPMDYRTYTSKPDLICDLSKGEVKTADELRAGIAAANMRVTRHSIITSTFEMDMVHYIGDQVCRSTLLTLWISKILDESQGIMKEAWQSRIDANRMILDHQAGGDGTAEKKHKGTKKKKK